MLYLFCCRACGAPLPSGRPRALYCSKRCKAAHEKSLLEAYRQKMRERLLDKFSTGPSGQKGDQP
jgi:hypothetical protein